MEINPVNVDYIDNLIKFSAEQWKRECSDHFVGEVEKAVTKAKEGAVEMFGGELRRHLARCLNGKAAYDYTHDEKKESILATVGTWRYSTNSLRLEILTLAGQIDDEDQILVNFNIDIGWYGQPKIVPAFLTRNGRFFFQEHFYHHDFNFEIPVQYATILDKIFHGVVECNKQYGSDGFRLDRSGDNKTPPYKFVIFFR